MLRGVNYERTDATPREDEVAAVDWDREEAW